ncbi:hypothetical protein M422DRAFT_89702, partial [Sphaerobolus stellatus SS14]
MLINPNDFECPDFSLPEYQKAREKFISPTCDDAQAAITLRVAWLANNEMDRERWQRTQEESAMREAEALRERAEREAIAAAAEAQELEEFKKEERKKNRAMYSDIPDRETPNKPPVIASHYATRQLLKGNYVELYYFSVKGLAEARATLRIGGDDEALI